jgi:hypothetical protein
MLRLALASLLGLAACSPRQADPLIDAPFTDAFDRADLGSDWSNTGGPYRIEGGRLVFGKVHNHPLWLKRRLPADVRIEVDCLSKSPDGDIKVEIFGDGKTFQPDEDVAKDLIYTASGYVLIFGGWKNSRSVIVRQDEHAWQHRPGVPMRTSPRVEPGRSYHFAIERRGAHIGWTIDGQPFLEMQEAEAPLSGPGHDRFGFNGWETEVSCDNLKIEPLTP